MIAIACGLTASTYLALYLYGAVCVLLGFVLGIYLSYRSESGIERAIAREAAKCGYQPVDRGQGQPSTPPRKP